MKIKKLEVVRTGSTGEEFTERLEIFNAAGYPETVQQWDVSGELNWDEKRTYDSNGQHVSSYIKTADGFDQIIDYTYDAEGRVSKISYRYAPDEEEPDEEDDEPFQVIEYVYEAGTEIIRHYSPADELTRTHIKRMGKENRIDEESIIDEGFPEDSHTRLFFYNEDNELIQEDRYHMVTLEKEGKLQTITQREILEETGEITQPEGESETEKPAVSAEHTTWYVYKTQGSGNLLLKEVWRMKSADTKRITERQYFDIPGRKYYTVTSHLNAKGDVIRQEYTAMNGEVFGTLENEIHPDGHVLSYSAQRTSRWLDIMQQPAPPYERVEFRYEFES